MHFWARGEKVGHEGESVDREEKKREINCLRPSRKNLHGQRPLKQARKGGGKNGLLHCP